MDPKDFQDYGPMRRRGRDVRAQRNMATPLQDPGYTSETIEMRTVGRRPAARPAPRRSGGWWWLIPLVLIIIALSALLGGLTYLDQTYAGRIYPNVSVQGVDLTEMTAPDAEQALRARFDTFLQAPVRFSYGGHSWQPRADEVGISINFRMQVDEAMRAGRGNGLMNDLRQIAGIWQQGLDLPLRVNVDARKLQAYVGMVGTDIEQPAREAALTVDTLAGTFQTSDSAEGTMLLLDDTVSEAIAGLESLEQQVVPIRTQALVPILETKDVAEASRTVEAMLQQPMGLRFVQETQTFTMTQNEIAEMIAVTRVEGTQGPALNAQLEQTKLKRWVTRLADKIGRESVEPRVNWNGGNLQIFREGRSAYRLDIDRAVEAINGAIVDSERVLDLPVDEAQPRATPENLASLGLVELVATGKSDFAGSAEYRTTNIKAGVNLMHGILVPPDGEFSFNENVGAIDEEHGFVEGYAIVGNRTQKEPGGGICQVSTTLFRAAFYAGVPFTDWTPHRFRISWYEKYDPIGMDSTIFTGGGPDLRFVNDTGNWLLIEGIVDDANASVTFNLYGTKVPGRTVERTEPLITNETPPPPEDIYINDPAQPAGTFKQTDTSRGGMNIEIVRVVKQDGVEVRRTPFLTQFEPWPDIFLKNPATPLPPGGKLGSD